MEQIKETEKIRMIKPEEWAQTHLEAHEKLNEVVKQFYWLLNDLIKRYNTLAKEQEDAEEKNFASFSKLEEKIDDLKYDIRELNKWIEIINEKLEKGWRFLTRRYEGILDTEWDINAVFDPITEDELKWRTYLANTVVNEVIPNQWTMTYSFPQTSIVHWEYEPHLYLKAKDGEHAVLEYDFTIILTEV